MCSEIRRANERSRGRSVRHGQGRLRWRRPTSRGAHFLLFPHQIDTRCFLPKPADLYDWSRGASGRSGRSVRRYGGDVLLGQISIRPMSMPKWLFATPQFKMAAVSREKSIRSILTVSRVSLMSAFPQIVVWWLNLVDQLKVLLNVTAIEYLTYLKEVKKVAFWEVSSRGREEKKEKWKKDLLTRFVFSSSVKVTLWKLPWQATRLFLHRC